MPSRCWMSLPGVEDYFSSTCKFPQELYAQIKAMLVLQLGTRFLFSLSSIQLLSETRKDVYL